jgi:uncharacterized protein with HEPN domain
MQRDVTVLLDIVQAAHLVLAFKEGMTKIAFDRDRKTQSAILHQLIVIGEAVKRLSPAFRERSCPARCEPGQEQFFTKQAT